METVDGLHRCCQVERLAERTHADVDQRSGTIGKVLIERPLCIERYPAQDGRCNVELWVPLDAHKRRAGRDEVAKRRQHLELDVRCTCEIDPVCLIHAKQHGRAR